jgi:DNA-directed RNA polymerase subunit beta'
VRVLDKLKELGFREATAPVVSIGIDRHDHSEGEGQEIASRPPADQRSEKQYRKGIITSGERYNKIVDIWTHATDQISNVMFKTLEFNEGKMRVNPVYSWWTPAPAVTASRFVSSPACAA